MAGLSRGEVRVAAPALHWLPDLVGGFLAAHPAARVQLFQQSPHEMRRRLDAGDIDFYWLWHTFRADKKGRFFSAAARETFCHSPRENSLIYHT